MSLCNDSDAAVLNLPARQAARPYFGGPFLLPASSGIMAIYAWAPFLGIIHSCYFALGHGSDARRDLPKCFHVVIPAALLPCPTYHTVTQSGPMQHFLLL